MKKESSGSLFLDQLEEDDENDQQADEDEDEFEHRSKSKKFRYKIHHSTNEGGAENVQESTVASNDLFFQKHSKLLKANPIKVNLIFRHRHYSMICTFTFFHKLGTIVIYCSLVDFLTIPFLELIGVNYSIENLSYSTAIDPRISVTSYESNLFSKLYCSSDTGFKCPNSTIEHLLRRHEIDSFLKLFPYTGFTYDWAQRIAGIEYLNPEEKPIISPGGTIRVKSSIAVDSIDKSIKAIVARFQSRINLQEQLHEIHTKRFIDTNKFESLLDSNEMFDNLNKTTLNPKSVIILFERLDADKFLAEMDLHPNKKHKLVEYFEEGHEKTNESEMMNDIFDQNNFIFKLILKNSSQIDHNSSYNLKAFIIIPHNYPKRWPFFLLTFDSTGTESTSFNFFECNWLQALEEHINVRLPMKVYQQAKNIDESLYSTTLLLRQVYDLQCGLDAIVDARQKLDHKSNESLEIYSGPKCVNSYLSMSIVQGRDHSLKFL